MVGVNKRIAALKFQGQGVLPTVKIFCCEQKIFSFLLCSCRSYDTYCTITATAK